MSNTGKQSPLGVNVLSALLTEQGLNINAVFSSWVGASTNFTDYTPGKLITDTVLNSITYAINEAYGGNPDGIPTSSVYNNLISIGANTVPALGNAKAPTYTWEEKIGPYGTGTFNLGDTKGWGGSLYENNLDSLDPNPATQWAYLRLLALQAWMEFNYNSTLETGSAGNPSGYRDFLQTFQTVSGFIQYNNNTILSIDNAKNFLEGTYSGMNDLITGDITNVNSATKIWGQDLINLGKALDLSLIEYFGLPSALLKTLSKNNALTGNLNLAIVSSGLQTDVVSGIIDGVITATPEQERKLYASFYLTVGPALKEVLVPLNCATQGLESVADLLNPKKLFPNSYGSLTVPIYNNGNQPTNSSKIYYLIYVQNGLNSQLTSPEVAEQVGSITLPGIPAINEQSNTSDNVTIQVRPVGFGSYLTSMIPNDIAVAAGAFSRSMQQIKNIKAAPIEKFAQVVVNLETMTSTGSNGEFLALDTNEGTANNLPTNLALQQQGRNAIALGSGPQNTYTISDFFGCMSGLPYNGRSQDSARNIPEFGLEGIFNKIKETQTQKLFNIYHELYLAVTWQRAKGSITQSVYYENVQPYDGVNPRIDNWYYTVDFDLDVEGGGYGRGTAAAPTVTFTPNNCAASLTLSVGTDDTNVSTFGRCAELNKNTGVPFMYATTTVFQTNAPAAPVCPEEFIEIQAPPIDTLPIQLNGSFSSGTNVTPGYSIGTLGTESQGTWYWPLGGTTPGMNSVIQSYIDQANLEIDTIYASNKQACDKLNTYWNNTGTQLTIEQRARQTALNPPLPDIREDYYSTYPSSIYTFVDSLPNYSVVTDPNMEAQTLESISDWNTTSGRSIVGLMRQTRNQERLTLLGVSLDNNISDVLSPEQQKNLIVDSAIAPSILVNGNVITTAPLGELNDTDSFVTTDPNYPKFNQGDAIVPGSFAASPYKNLIPPSLNTWYTSSTLMPSTLTVEQAIDETIRCNCDCWKII